MKKAQHLVEFEPTWTLADIQLSARLFSRGALTLGSNPCELFSDSTQSKAFTRKNFMRTNFSAFSRLTSVLMEKLRLMKFLDEALS